MIGTMSTSRPTVRHQTPQKKRLPPIILMTDDDRLPDPSQVLADLPRGSAVVVRSRDPIVLAQRAEQLRPITLKLGVKLLIANDWRFALHIKADGLHLSESTWRHHAPYWRGHVKPDWLVTAACHSHVAPTDVDALILSPIFATASHPQSCGLGVLGFQRFADANQLPVYPMGGMSVNRLRRLHGTDHPGFAGISLKK